MTEYQHSDRETNGNLTPGDSRRPQGDFSRPQRAEGGEPSFRVAVTMKKDNGHTSKEWELVDTEGRSPTGQFRAKPVQVDYLDNQIAMDQVDAKMDGYERQRLEAETRKLAGAVGSYWREGSLLRRGHPNINHTGGITPVQIIGTLSLPRCDDTGADCQNGCAHDRKLETVRK
ncbi:hypothetical protein BSL78_18470 [Apostichopus japonicus]|uniref:Uncharacterized protein n=1 Tax=Stichopus japonicus TaxID=307972 RepID=A0A2G8K9J0_STIJA|nr:hypothetical protein BSL78_18470 [Apostichopus japonicus]